MGNRNQIIAENIVPLIGGKENVEQVIHCMTRLRITLNNYDKVDIESIKKIEGVKGCQRVGEQLQIIIGTNVEGVFDVFCKLCDVKAKENNKMTDELEPSTEKKTVKTVIDNVFAYISGSLSPLIPLLLAAGFCKTFVAILGPGLLGVLSESSDVYTLLTFLGDSGFYFLPIFIANFAAKKLNVNSAIAMLIAAAMIHPTFVQMGSEGTAFTVFGIPCNVQNYTSTVIPILLTIWIMSYIERFLKKIIPDAIKVIVVPFGTYIITMPIALCVLGPAGNFVGNYVCSGLIALHDFAAPLAVAILGATFILLVVTGMHAMLYMFLFTSFPTMGFDSFILPGIYSASWVMLGIALALFIKFKDKEMKSTVMSTIVTWLVGGVGEPMIYGILLKYKSALAAAVISGGITGLVAGLLGLTAHVLNAQNGIYSIAAFLGGSTSNYVALIITTIAAIVSGFLVMMFIPVKEEGK